MKIAITADPGIPVPPNLYGGIERVIDLLIRELSSKGHDVTLFAHRDSKVSCQLLPYPGIGGGLKDTLRNMWVINKTLLSGHFDLVHSFGRLAYLLPVLPANLPKLMSYQREPTYRQIKRSVQLARAGSLAFTGCSDYITGQIKPLAEAYTVYNGVDTTKYTVQVKVAEDAPLIFLGRIEPIKGTHIAVQAALKTGHSLKIAGNIPPEHQDYFDKEIAPHLSGRIQYVGPVDDARKADLLQTGLGLLMPIRWNEPFGIVMIEAMACGTPVIGFNRGSVPEVIGHGINGFIADTFDEFTGFIQELPAIDRSAVRKNVEEKFSGPVIAANYMNIYEKLIDRTHV